MLLALEVPGRSASTPKSAARLMAAWLTEELTVLGVAGVNISSEMRRPPRSLVLALGLCDARPGPCCELIDSCTLPKALPKLAGDMRVTGCKLGPKPLTGSTSREVGGFSTKLAGDVHVSGCKLGPKPLTGSTSREVGSFSTLGPREERAAGADGEELA